MARELPPLALTMGEPGGIGPDVTLLAWLRRARASCAALLLPGRPGRCSSARRRPARDRLSDRRVAPDEAAATLRPAPCRSCRSRPRSTPSSGPRRRRATRTAVIEAIARAVGDVRSGAAAAIVTNPINKKALYDAGFRHPGHTEFLGHLSAAWTGAPVTAGDDARRPAAARPCRSRSTCRFARCRRR